MRWEGQRESGNIEDRRGMGPARIGGGLGLGGLILVLAVSYFTGINPLTLINVLNGVQEVTDPSTTSEPAPIDRPTTSWENSPRLSSPTRRPPGSNSLALGMKILDSYSSQAQSSLPAAPLPQPSVPFIALMITKSTSTCPSSK